VQGVGGFCGGPGDFSGRSSDEETKNLTSKDIIVLKSLDNVKVVMGTVSSSGDLTYLSKTAQFVLQVLMKMFGVRLLQKN
jgi:hypothetical protein